MNAQEILVLFSVLGCVLTTSRLAAQSSGPGDAGVLGSRGSLNRDDNAGLVTPPANITDPVGIEPVRVQFDPPFIISYWGGPPKEEMTLARYKEIADCGFNVAFPSGGDMSSKHLDLCREAGIKGLVFLENLDNGMPWGQGQSAPTAEEIPGIEKALDVSLARFASHPALFGYFLADEPNIAQFERIGMINRYLLKKDPRHLPMVNLFPNYVNLPDWKGEAYEKAVGMYINTVKPSLVSWDHYRQVFEG